jgi:cyclase
VTPIPRVIPSLLLRNGGLVKTVGFKNPVYVGDPINAVKIFNDKEVDELVLLDIDASRKGRGPDFALLGRIAREAFMPMAYGGGLRSLDDLSRVLGMGYEKIAINSVALQDIDFVRRAADACGSQSVVVSIDVKRDLFGRHVVFDHVSGKTRGEPAAFARQASHAGAGEVLLNAVHRDGTQEGYDLEVIRKVAAAVDVPLVALGGAGSIKDFNLALAAGASAVAAGSIFVFHGPRRAVLITYPDRSELDECLLPGRAGAT